MPYINKFERQPLDEAINELIAILRQHSSYNAEKYGQVNYAITRLVLGAMRPPALGWTYHSISRVLAVLADSREEIARRLMGPREDHVIELNGDLTEFSDAFPEPND